MKKLVFVLMLLALLVTPSLALAGQPGYEVRGLGKLQIFPGDLSVSEIHVNAWLDDNGEAHGMLTWVGGVSPGTIPPAYPWQMEVTSIVFSSGNTATVCWVVVHSVVPEDIGFEDCFDFTDNRATGAPDEISGVPLEAGNIIVR